MSEELKFFLLGIQYRTGRILALLCFFRFSEATDFTVNCSIMDKRIQGIGSVEKAEKKFGMPHFIHSHDTF